MNATTEPRTTDRPARVLIVEEDPLLRQLFEMEALDLGCRVECAASGADAVDALTSAVYDVALVDVRISDPDLRGLISTGRAAQSGTRFVTLIPFHERPRLSEAMALTPFACLQLPFRPGALRSVIGLALRKAGNGRGGPSPGTPNADGAVAESGRAPAAEAQSAAGRAKP